MPELPARISLPERHQSCYVRCAAQRTLSFLPFLCGAGIFRRVSRRRSENIPTGSPTSWITAPMTFAGKMSSSDYGTRHASSSRSIAASAFRKRFSFSLRRALILMLAGPCTSSSRQCPATLMALPHLKGLSPCASMRCMCSSRRQMLLSFSEVEVMSADPSVILVLFAKALRKILPWSRGSASPAGTHRDDICFRFSLCKLP